MYVIGKERLMMQEEKLIMLKIIFLTLLKKGNILPLFLGVKDQQETSGENAGTFIHQNYEIGVYKNIEEKFRKKLESSKKVRKNLLLLKEI